jgi:predicted alpha/beta hydrolase family esterase
MKQMKKQVLFIQGAGEGSYKEDEKLVESLRLLLGSSYEIRYPAMKNEDDAPYEVWVGQVQEELAALTDGVILIGHSVGGSVLIKFLAEIKIKKAIAGIFIIAAPFWGGDGGWTYEGYEELVLPNQADTNLPKGVPIFLYHSNDDEVVPFAHLALYAKNLPGAINRELDGRGHQLNHDLSEVANDIKKLTFTS